MALQKNIVFDTIRLRSEQDVVEKNIASFSVAGGAVIGKGLNIGTTTNQTPGNLRYNNGKFQGFIGCKNKWVNLNAVSNTGCSPPENTIIIFNNDATDYINSSVNITDCNNVYNIHNLEAYGSFTGGAGDSDAIFVFGTNGTDYGGTGGSEETKMFFIKNKGAFRTGVVSTGGWNINNVGIGSFASGINTIASGDYSHAEGKETQAIGDYSHAEGQNTNAEGNSSHAEGYYTQSTTIGSHSEGIFTKAIGGSSHSEGSYTIANGEISHAEGYYTVASGFMSHSQNYQTTASGNYSHAEGQETVASGVASHASGYQTLATGDYSHAEGRETVASGIGSHSEGYLNTASGEYSHAEGNYTNSTQFASHSEGSFTTASGFYSHAEGRETTASGEASHSEGYQTTASGHYSHVGGSLANASHQNSFVWGNSNTTETKSVVDGGAVFGGDLLVGKEIRGEYQLYPTYTGSNLPGLPVVYKLFGQTEILETTGTTLNSLIGNGVGTHTIPANYLVTGTTINIFSAGTIEIPLSFVTGPMYNLNGLNAKIGGNIAYAPATSIPVLTSNAKSIDPNQSNSWEFRMSSTYHGNNILITDGLMTFYNPLATPNAIFSYHRILPININTSIANTITFNSQTTNADINIQTTIFYIEISK